MSAATPTRYRVSAPFAYCKVAGQLTPWSSSRDGVTVVGFYKDQVLPEAAVAADVQRLLEIGAIEVVPIG